MINIIRVVIGVFFLSIGFSYFFNGKIDWMIAAGFNDWKLPAIFTIIGLAFFAISVIRIIPTKHNCAME